jgi:hypothetical protein
MRRTLARTFILEFVAATDHAFNGFWGMTESLEV